MHNNDRGIIKWAPFNSVISNKKMINDILNERNKIKMPCLSEEQKNIIEKQIINSYFSNENISLDYYYNGKIYHIHNKIKKIDEIYHRIYFDNKIILFNQIIKIY